MDALSEALFTATELRVAEHAQWSGREKAGDIETDLHYVLAIIHMQSGEWRRAAQDLAALEDRYGELPQVLALQESLALHLATEEKWEIDGRRRPWLPRRTLHTLLIANAVLYGLIVTALLFLAGRALPLI